MESCSWIDGKLDGYRFPWNFKRQLEPSSDFSRHEFWAIFGRQGPKPHRDVVVAQWEERLEAYFWLVRYQWAALLHHSPYLLYFYVGQPTRGQIVILFFSTADVFECEPPSWLKFRVIFKTACFQWKHSTSPYIHIQRPFRISLSIVPLIDFRIHSSRPLHISSISFHFVNSSKEREGERCKRCNKYREKLARVPCIFFFHE